MRPPVLSRIYVLAGLLLIASPLEAWAFWSCSSTENTAICDTTGDQSAVSMDADGAGGAVFAWQDRRNGTDNNIYVQRVDALGTPQWGARGVLICSASGDQTQPKIISDGAGGAFATWRDGRAATTDIYAQRVNSSGVAQWTPDGEPVCTATNSQHSPALTSDGAGGIIICWNDQSSGASLGVFAQRLDGAGTRQWLPLDGVLVSTNASAGTTFPKITADGSGGAVMLWSYSFPEDLAAQRINSLGTRLWGANGVIISNATNTQVAQDLYPDGTGGAYFVWNDSKDATRPDVYAQRVNGAGTPQWAGGGIAVAAANDIQSLARMTTDGAGGVIIAWQDRRTPGNQDIYGQRLNSAGTAQWTPNGLPICTGGGANRFVLAIASDGFGGAVITWDQQLATIYDIYAERINSSGAPQWGPAGVPVSSSPGDQRFPLIVPAGGGSSIITWADSRNLPGQAPDIYAQRLASNGGLGGPGPCGTPSGPTAEIVTFPAGDPAYDLVGDVDVTPRILPATGFSSRAAFPTATNLLFINTLTDLVESTTPLPSASVRGIDPAYSPDGSRMAILTIGHILFFDVTTTPPTLLASLPNSDTPVTDCDPSFVSLGGSLYCIVPYVGTVRVYGITGAVVTLLYTQARSSIGIDAVDPVVLGGTCSVPNVTTADFFDIATGGTIGTVMLPFPSVREVDMVPVPEVGRVFWPLDGAICRFDPTTATLDATMPIPGTSVEGCDMLVEPAAPSIGPLGVFGNTGFLHFINLAGPFVISSVPTPGVVIRNFDPLITPWALGGGAGPTIYWSVLDNTYVLDPAFGAPLITIPTPGGLTDGCDLTASNDFTRAVLPHSGGFVHVIDLQSGTLVGPGDGTILTPGTLRVDLDPMFPTVPVDTTLSSRIIQPFRGGLLILRRFSGDPNQCIVSMAERVHVLDLASMTVSASYDVPQLAEGVDPVITQGVQSPYDDVPYRGRDRDQDFLCNQAQTEPYILPTWYLPYWPLRTPWYPLGLGWLSVFDWWGRSGLEVLGDRRGVSIVDQKDASLIATLTLPDTIVGGATYDRDWRRARFYLDNGRIASVDFSGVQASPPHRPNPVATTRVVPGASQWPPANDSWGGHDIVLADSGSTVRIVSYTGGADYIYPLPAPAIYPPTVDYKNSTATVVLRNYRRYVFDLYPLSYGNSPLVVYDDYYYAGYYWQPVCNTVYDEMNRAGMNLAYQRQTNQYSLVVYSEYTANYLWHYVLPYPPLGQISVENKSKLAKVPMQGGYEAVFNLSPLAWGGNPLVDIISVTSLWWRPPVWDFYGRCEVTQNPPYALTVWDAYRRQLVSTVNAPTPMTGSVVIDPIHQYLRVRLQNNQSFFLDLFKLRQGVPYYLASRTDSYSGNLLQDAVFDPVGGMDLAVVDNGSAANIVVMRSRTGASVATVNLPGKPARPIHFDPYNRTAEIVLSGGQVYLLDLSLVDDSGSHLPVLRSASLPGPALSGIDLTPPAAPNLAGMIATSNNGQVIQLHAPAGAVEPKSHVAIVNQTRESIDPAEVLADSVGGFVGYTVADSGEVACVIAGDVAGNVGTPTCVVLNPTVVVGVEESPAFRNGISSILPNPSAGSFVIDFTVATASAMRLEIFDAVGRRVRVVAAENMEPGAHFRTWDGRSDGGRAVRAGSYFVRLTINGVHFGKRIVLVR